MEIKRGGAPAWNRDIDARTRDYLSLVEVPLTLHPTTLQLLDIRAWHHDGRSGQLSVKSLFDGGNDLTVSIGAEVQRFDTVDRFIAAGWAVPGRTIAPWRGGQYGSPSNVFGGVRVMLLGEVTRVEDLPVGDARQHLLAVMVCGAMDDDDCQALSRVADVLAAASDALAPNRQDLWESVAFANVVPVVAANDLREPTPERLFQLCSPYLDEAVEELKPDVVLVFGKMAWGWFNWALVHRRTRWSEPSETVRTHGALCACAPDPVDKLSVGEAGTMLRYLLRAARTGSGRPFVQPRWNLRK